MVSPDPYGARFHQMMGAGSATSARVVVPLVVDLLHPRSVIDVGCGPGRWLAEFKHLGVPEVLGIDGPGAAVTSGLSDHEFRVHDLRSPLALERRFDLAVCLEVAEHLPEADATSLVAELAGLAPVVLFSAAIPHQGGTGHLNEQWPEYWAGHFATHGLVPVDCLRSQLWAHPDVEFWYAQNILIFARPEVIADHDRLSSAASLTRPDALAHVHPALYLAKVRAPVVSLRTVASGLRALLGRVFRSVRRAAPVRSADGMP